MRDRRAVPALRARHGADRVGDDPDRRELADRGHELHVVTSLPWYRPIASSRGGPAGWVATERDDWGSITPVHPFPGDDDKSNLARRAIGFAGFSALAGWAGSLPAGGSAAPMP